MDSAQIMNIISLIILLILSSLFSCSETAFLSVSKIKIRTLAEEGNKKAKSIKKMLKDPSKFLATIQIGITLAGFLSSAFASESFASRLAPVLNSINKCRSME